MADTGLTPPEFANFYRATLAPLRRYLSRIVGCPSDAQDLAQDAYLRTYAAAVSERLAQPQAFLYTTAKHLAINRLRRRKLEPISGTAPSVFEGAPSEAPGVERIVMARQEWEQLERTIAELPPGCRSVLLLRKVERLSHEDIAKRLGISRSTVEKQLARALRLLREGMKRSEQPDGDAETAPPDGFSVVA